MMSYFRNHIGRFFTFIIALQILNMSIDSPSAQMPPNAQNSDDFNYIDTYVEFIAEVVLKYDNAIPETKNREKKEMQMQKQFELVFQKIESLKFTFFQDVLNKPVINFNDQYAYQFI